MPELPEVETVVRSLRPQIVGKTMGRVWSSGLPLRMARPLDETHLRSSCLGATVTAVSRRGKYILIALQCRGRQPGTLLVHLGMTGRLRVEDKRAPRLKHTHVAWTLGGGRELRFVDPRRFGWVQAADDVAALPEIAALGPDPLGELDVDMLARTLATSAAPIKAFLLDQKRVAGVGNIYADEALFRAQIHPLRRAGALTRAQTETLAGTVRDALTAGLVAGGATIDDFRHPDGVSGAFQNEFLVHRREGEDCPRCCGEIVKFVAAGRGTYVCERCQPRPRGVRRPARAPRGARSGRP